MSSAEAKDSGEVDTFIIKMWRDADTPLGVSSVELVSSEMRNRYSFRTLKGLHELFAGGLADVLEACLSRIKTGERFVAMPDFEYAGKGLIMSGLRMLVTVGDDGSERIMLRIRNYIGAIKSVFKFDPAMTVSSVSTREKIAVDVLQDIISPLFDLMALDVPGMDEIIEKHAPAIRKRLSKLSSKQEEVIFFTGLLQRYVSGCKQDAIRADNSSAAIEPPQDFGNQELVG